jgi:hypothetical protein
LADLNSNAAHWSRIIVQDNWAAFQPKAILHWRVIHGPGFSQPKAILHWRDWELCSNVTLPKEMQRSKENTDMILTEVGMQIDFSDEHLQIDRPSIRSNLEFGSNVTFSRE